MDQKSSGVRSRLSNDELKELYRCRLRAVQNINRNDPTRFRIVHNRSVGLPNNSPLTLNEFNIDDSKTSSRINPTPPQNPTIDLSSTQQHPVGNLGLLTPPVDVQSTHRSFYQGTVGSINAPSRIAVSYPMYPSTRTRQDNLRPLFDYSPDEVNWSTYVPLIRSRPNVIGPLIPPRYRTVPIYDPITGDQTGLYHQMEGIYRHCNSNSVDFCKCANRNNNNIDEDDNNDNMIM